MWVGRVTEWPWIPGNSLALNKTLPDSQLLIPPPLFPHTQSC